MRGLPRFDGRSAFSTWVYRIATNAAIDEMRRRRRRPRLLTAREHDAQQSNDPTAEPRPRDGPLLADGLVDRLELDAALQRLPVEFRAAVVLRDVLGLDYAEIADVLELPAGTVRSRIARGRAALARSLRAGDADPRESGNQRPPPDVGRAEPS